MSSDTTFTGYDPSLEPRDMLASSCIDYDFEQFMCSGDIPDTRGLKHVMRRDDQYQMNSCAGFGCTNAGEVGFFLQTGKWRQFNPHWTYRRGQEISNIRGDRGATIFGVVEGAKRNGFLPEDIENDGKAEFPFPRDNYGFQYPASASQLAKDRTIGYSVEIKSWQAAVNFLQSGQGAIVIGGPWGNWSPDRRGICRRFAGGGGGHARAWIDWETIDGELMLVEINSHFKTYGDNGFAYHAQSFVDAQFADRSFVAIGISDVKLGPGDQPKQRPHRRYVKLVS